MTCWDKRGCGICQSCGTVGPGHEVRRIGIEFLRVLGWRYWCGDTIGGQPYEDLLCPQCCRSEKKRVIVRCTIEQDQLPIEWKALG